MKPWEIQGIEFNKNDIEKAMKALDDNKYDENSFITNKLGNEYNFESPKENLYGPKRIVECICKNKYPEKEIPNFNSTRNLRRHIEDAGFKMVPNSNKDKNSSNKKVLDSMVLAMYENDNTGTTQYPPSKISELDKIEGAVSTHRDYLQKHCEKCDEADNSGTFPTYFIHHGPKGGGTYSLSKSGLERAKEITEEISETLKGEDMSEQPLNQILYGPPGTGKTYNTVVEAMSIINNEKYENVSDEEYSKLKKDFDDLLGKRIEFVTFHQSYSYEEFVEGIKPEIDWNENKEKADVESKEEDNNDDKNKNKEIRYIGKKGVFREICKRADEEIPFDELYKLFMEKYPAGSTIRWENYEYVISYNDNESFTDNTKTNSSMPVYKLQQFYEENKKNRFSTPTELRKFAEKQDNPSSNGMEHSTFVVINLLENLLKPYVLIIDEINRGNISKIFGELITLIEEDKRGKFKVRLPYSQDEFTVPENLYIIGTMNTSDRSIASVDIALRRRFTFKEMMPDPKLVADFGLKDTKLKVGFKDIYKILNKKITIFADRDHQIGHSYFIKDKHEGENINDLKNIWFDSVMPLLNEYFYGDWEKLQQILGKAEEEDDKKEEAEKEEDKYTSFIKKISFKDLNLDTSCFDENCDCFDFVEDNKINFEGALKKAFYPEGDKKTDKKNSTRKPESEVVEGNTEE